MKRHLLALVSTPVLGLALPAIADDAPAPLSLACQAGGDVVSTSRRHEWVKGADGKESYEPRRTSEVIRKDVRYEIVVDGASARLRMPEGDSTGLFGKKPVGGWFPIERLQVGDDAIAGRVNFGFMDAPSLRIDRRTGAFSIGDFKGDCQRMPTERKF